MKTLTIFLLVALVGYSVGCKCAPQPSKQAFCNADWVSHVKIKIRLTKQPLVSDPNRPGLNHIKYAVEHKKIFKKPADLKTLNNEIYTPSESAACGVILDSGKEYLLAGRVNNGTLVTGICGQVLPDNEGAATYENVLQWNHVPADLENAMPAYQC